MKFIHTQEEIAAEIKKIQRELEADKLLFILNETEEVNESDVKAVIKNIKDKGWHQGYITCKYEMAERILQIFEIGQEAENN